MSDTKNYTISESSNNGYWIHSLYAEKEIVQKWYDFELPYSKDVRNYSDHDVSYKKDIRKIKTILKNGFSNVMRTRNAQDKIKKTNVEKYGVENPFQSKDIKTKIKKTNVEKYGVENPQQNEEIKNKTQQTNIEKYGNACALNNSEISEKKKKTWLSKYGTVYPWQSDIIKEKKKTNSIEKYGVEHPMQDHGIKNNIIQKRQKNLYGMSKDDMRILWRKEFIENGFNSAMSKYPKVKYLTAIRYFLNDDEKEKNVSILEKDVKTQIENVSKMHFQQSCRGLLSNNRLEIDLSNVQNKISIEFNGVYWHQIHSDKLEQDLSKAEEMRGIGYRHFALDETDMSKLGLLGKMISPNKFKLYARKLELKVIKNPKEFLDNNHLQGSVRANIAYGLFLNDELIQTMTFGHSRFDKSIDWEILRLCTKPEYLVVGGAERLFKAFMKEYNPSSVVSYSDNKYFDGKVYGKLGLKFIENTQSNYVWWKNGISLKRYQTMKHKLKDVLGDRFDPILTEKENMENNGWIQIKDLGNKKWIFKRSYITA